MASNQQPYGYPPPPPPPPAQSGPSAYPSYNPQVNYNQPPQTNGRGRGGGGRGRGGNFTQGGRGDFHSPSPYNTGGYSAPGGYGAPPAVNGGYGTQTPSYGNQPATSGYPSGPPPPQWQHEPQHHQPQAQAAPPPIPLSAQNYHPNYAPQVYQSQPTVYGQPPQQTSQPQQQPLHQQQPQYQNPPPTSYAQTHSQQPPLPGGGPQQWGHHPQTHFSGGRGGRGRGGSHQGRGGFDAPLMGPPIRMGFDNDHVPQASSNGFPPFTAPQHGSPSVNVSSSSPSPLYSNNQNGYRSQDYSQRGGGGQRGGHRAPLDPNPFYANNGRGGRGGFSNQRGNFSNRGNRGDSNGFKPRFNRGDFKGYTDNRNYSTSEPASDLPQKPGNPNTGIASSEGGKKKKQKKKRKTNTLGLTPGNGEDSGTEDDADEETRLASLVIGAASLPTDLQSWIAERKRKWPTAAIREAKAAELAKRREQAREQSMRDKAKAQKDREERAAIEAKLAQVQKADKDSKKSKKHDGESKLERQQRKAEKLRKQLEKAEKKVQHAIQAGSKRKREAGDEGDDLIKQEDASGDQPKAEDNDSSSDSSSSSDSDDSDDESEPEAQSSRIKNERDWNFKPHPLLHTKPCKYFSSGGTCGKMNKCRFIHDQAARDASLKERARDGGRVSLAELLLQNEQDKENLTVLKAIQYVAESGLLDEPQQSSSSATGQTTDEKVGAAEMGGEAQTTVEASDNDDSGGDNFHEAMTDVAST